MRGLLPWVLLLLAVVAMTARADDLNDQELEQMSDKVFRALDRQVDRLGEDDEQVRSGKSKIAFGKKLSELVKKIWSKIPKDKIKNAVKSTIREVKNTIKEKGKEKLHDMKVKLVKEGKKQAKSFLKHEILKFIKKKAEKTFCSCPNKYKCGCCMHLPGLDRGCFNMTALPAEMKFRVNLNYGGETIAARKIAGTKEMMTCTHLPTPLNLVEICIVTQGIQEIDESNFKGCFRIVSHGLEAAKCILFENGITSLV
uniref:Venom protein family 2 protein 12 n=1 Tax=Lethocerus distinctifemur TaxID=280095 RepID=A0A2K8JLG8_9HEMI|nr:venom protein family 2 protein 12 [Lethocerus distinctifemur]